MTVLHKNNSYKMGFQNQMALDKIDHYVIKIVISSSQALCYPERFRILKMRNEMSNIGIALAF